MFIWVGCCYLFVTKVMKGGKMTHIQYESPETVTARAEAVFHEAAKAGMNEDVYCYLIWDEIISAIERNPAPKTLNGQSQEEKEAYYTLYQGTLGSFYARAVKIFYQYHDSGLTREENSLLERLCDESIRVQGEIARDEINGTGKHYTQYVSSDIYGLIATTVTHVSDEDLSAARQVAKAMLSELRKSTEQDGEYILEEMVLCIHNYEEQFKDEIENSKSRLSKVLDVFRNFGQNRRDYVCMRLKGKDLEYVESVSERNKVSTYTSENLHTYPSCTFAADAIEPYIAFSYRCVWYEIIKESLRENPTIGEALTKAIPVIEKEYDNLSRSQKRNFEGVMRFYFGEDYQRKAS